jgi:hypothetical protein
MQATLHTMAMGRSLFCSKLLDYELSSNVGMSGTGIVMLPLILEYLILKFNLKV